MGTGQTPERVPAELRPPRPAPRAKPMAGAAEQLAVRVKAAADAADELAACVKPAAFAAEQLAARVKAAEVAVDQHLMPQHPLPARPLDKQTPQERDDDLQAVAAATPAVPPVAPRSMQPSHRRASGRLPVVPVAALQAPSPGRTDPTPSPVPRVSLVPPTGRIEGARHALHGASDARNQPTVAARRHADAGAAAAHTVPPSDGAPSRGFIRRLIKDLRSSKREVLLGLGIGVGLSFALVRWGQEYLAHRAAPESELTVESLAVNPAPHRPPATRLPAAPPPPRPLPAPSLPAQLPAPASAAPSNRGGAALMQASPMVQSVLTGERQASQRRSSAQGAKGAKPASATRAHTGGASGVLGEDAPLEAPGEELEPRDLDRRDKAPLSPSQSAGLGLDLPL